MNKDLSLNMGKKREKMVNRLDIESEEFTSR
jgi:hypothetical protein